MLPRGLSGGAGLILCVHGGGWIEGCKDEYAADLLRAGEKGFAAAAVNYRYVSETVRFDDVLHDLDDALAAIRDAGETFGVRFDRSMLTGISAGGHLSLLYAFTRRETAPVRPVCVAELCGPPDLEDPFYYAGTPDIPRRVGADFYREVIGRGAGCRIPPDGPGEAADALRRCSPLTYVDENAVPVLLGHGERDDIVPYRGALALRNKLAACRVPHAFIPFRNTGHECEDKDAMSRFMDAFFRLAGETLRA